MKECNNEEIKNKKLMFAMWVIIIVSTIFYVGLLLLAVFTLEEGVLLGSIICASTLVYVIACFIALKFEVDAGYYECKNCQHRHAPSYKTVLFSSHMATTRYLKCPECQQKTWSKKVMSK